MDKTALLHTFVELRSCLIRNGSDVATLLDRPDGADRVLKILSDAERIIQRLQPSEKKEIISLIASADSHDTASSTTIRKREFLVNQAEIIRRAHGKKVGDYEQRLPKGRFETIWQSLLGLPAGREFSPQDLTAASKVPSYQAYIAIDVLVSRGYLDSPRRGAFRIRTSDTLALTAQDVWASIEAE
jgi:hypothetical protein